ncbi:PAS domain-containing protein [Bacillus sp. OV166]|uniref:PAS domain-containing protein n=1 Tax=Bacillus sp. OV166 TaxID=1882763 RepID=UPI000B43B816|nr:PAS domain-containing protein [Bacillus sp. OV166]
MYKDFTEQMEIQRKLEESEVCYRKLVEFLPDAVIVQNKHHIVLVNPAGVKILGQECSKDMIGRSYGSLLIRKIKYRGQIFRND